ncbi:MAG: peptidoglycan DD-metalloendopeptidase family protein [Turicibacter sp.]|nr:peptidoglycan DD-metalloendopeptidase family protein [Turicibacter sp.]
MNHKRKYLVVFLLATIIINSFQIVANASSFGFMDSFENPMLPEEEELVLPGMYEEVSMEDIPTESRAVVRSAEAGRWIWPTAEFYPVICKYLCYKNHHAIDLYAPTGTAIYAGRDGVVEQVISTCPNMFANQKECGGGYGNYITIKHATGVYSRYAHLNSVDVKKGQKVSAGQKIGTIGTSGRVGAAHLHFEIRQDTRGMAAGGWDPLDSTRFNYVLPSEKNSAKVGWVKESNQWYYYKGGKKQTGWQKVDGTWYYLNSSGVMQTGWLKDRGTWYYLKSSGAMATGWEKVNGTWYYLNSSGAMQTGWQKVDGTWYYLNSSGAMLTGWQKVDGTWYYLNSSGAMLAGWQDIGGARYYLNLSNGAMLTGWQKIDGNWYYFYSGGSMATNTEIDGWSIDANGIATKIEQIQNGWIKLGNDWLYYVDGVEQTGLQEINGNRYYFNQHGIMQIGWQTVNNVRYYFYESGKMATNTEIDGWSIDANGVATKIEVVLNGWQKIDGDWYYYVNNVKQTGWLTLGNDKYYLKADGKMMSDEWLTQNNKKYYFAANGLMKKGWIEWRHQWYYTNQNGEMLTSGTVDGWIITPSGMAYLPGRMNPDYVVNKSIERLLNLEGFIYNPNLTSSNAKHTTITGQPGYDEALTEAVVVEVLTSGKSQFNVYLDENTVHIFIK